MKTIGWILLALSAFMFVGYLGADVSGAAAVGALLITVVLPAAGGLAMVTGRLGTSRRIGGSREELRRQTLEAELLRLAGRHGGRITIVEAVSDLAVTPEEAKEALDALTVRGLADFEVTDSGVIVYVFHDLRHIGEKRESRGLLG
jgi:hypothetical protein